MNRCFRLPARLASPQCSRFGGAEPNHRIPFRLLNRHHNVNLAFRVPGQDWVPLETTYETSEFHHNISWVAA